MWVEITMLLIKHMVGNNLDVQPEGIDQRNQRAVIQWYGDAVVTKGGSSR